MPRLPRFALAALAVTTVVTVPTDARAALNCPPPNQVVPLPLATGQQTLGITEPLVYGAPDHRYRVTARPPGGPVVTAAGLAYVVRPRPGYVANSAASAWISSTGAVTGEPDPASPFGLYTYSIQFVLPPLSTSELDLRYAADNGVSIQLNGVAIGGFAPPSPGDPSAYGTKRPLFYNGSALRAGMVNTLALVVVNWAGYEAVLLEGVVRTCVRVV